MPADRARIARLTLACYWVLIFVGTHWPDVHRYKRHPTWPFPGFGYVVHGVMYGGWAAMWWWVLRSGSRTVPRSEDLTKVWMVGLTYAAFDELSQYLVGRTGKLSDLLTDVAAVALVLLVLRLWAGRARKLERRSAPGGSAGVS